MTHVPNLRTFNEVDPSWNVALKAALAEVHAETGRAEVTLTAAWDPWLAGWAEPQVIKWGKLVVCVGLIKNVSGSSITPTANLQVATVPSGYRPRDVGTGVLGGRLITTQYSGTSAPYRVDFRVDGQVCLDPTTPTPIINGGYLSLFAMWRTD
jgi:hypothetical protein